MDYDYLFSNILDEQRDASMAGLPPNRTLYVDQFTDEAPQYEDERAPFAAKSMKDVFEHYQPSKTIELQDEKGDLVFEEFVFSDLKDFEDEQLIAQSHLLTIQKEKIEGLRVCTTLEECFRNNLNYIHSEVRQLEISYRALDTFFANATEKVDYLTLMNVDKSELGMLYSYDTQQVVAELSIHYDMLSLNACYSLFVLPGYLVDAVKIRWWADRAWQNRVIMVTDFKDYCENFGELRIMLEKANLQGSDTCLGNVVMTCNPILVRKKSELANEEDNLHLPGSAALAGRMSNVNDNMIALGMVGKEHGIINKALGTHLQLNHSEIESLVNMGVVPMVEENGQTMACSCKTLYIGATKSLQEYPTVRVFYWVGKVFQHYVNERAYENWDASVREEITESVDIFLHKLCEQRIIENYYMVKIVQDQKTKDVIISVRIKPLYIDQSFTIELIGKSDHYGISWEQIIS